MLIVDLFVSYAHVNLCHFFSSSWCRGLAAAFACGSSWTFLFTFFHSVKCIGTNVSDDFKFVCITSAFQLIVKILGNKRCFCEKMAVFVYFVGSSLVSMATQCSS